MNIPDKYKQLHLLLIDFFEDYPYFRNFKEKDLISVYEKMFLFNKHENDFILYNINIIYDFLKHYANINSQKDAMDFCFFIEDICINKEFIIYHSHKIKEF
jgi:hypothetical protein